MKRNLDILLIAMIFITILLCSNTIKAQRLYSESGDFYEKSKRNVVDHAKLGVFYELKFRKDSTKLDDYTEAQTVLMVSDKHLLFSDYNRLAFDSINDYLASSKQNKKDQKAREEWMQAIKKWTFFFVTLTDLEEQKTTVQTYDVLRSYEYTYPTPQMDWQLVSGDSIINQRACKKATCSFAGRNYIAWYTETIALPYGPYLFTGLPGLIMEIHDEGRNWIFTNNGFGAMSQYSDMYLYKKKYIKDLIVTTHENALTGYRNDIEDFDNLSIEIYNVKIEKNGKMVTPEANNPKRPSNMLELKW